jgi:ATP-dependent Lhr-like helicase
LQRLALSATVPDPGRVARAYLGPEAAVVAVPGQRDIEARIVVASGDDRARARAAVHAADDFPDIAKTLIFVNSRKQVDLGADDFRFGRFADVPAYGHHGSLSKVQREEAEARFKADRRAVCVATMTLEVGIDIGDIDLVICMDPPFSVSGFLQRIGRGCRRLGDRTRVVGVARDRAGELMFEAMIRQAALGMPPVPTAPLRRSVLVQQVLAYLRQVEKHRRTVEQFVRVLASSASPPVDRGCISQILADMVRTGLLAERHGVFEPASAGWEFIEGPGIYSNIRPTPPEVALVDADSGRELARVAGLGRDAAGVRIAGRSYDVLPGGSTEKRTVRGAGGHAEAPRYHSRSLPYAADVGAALAGRLGLAANHLAVVPRGDGFAAMTWLGRLRNALLAEGLRRLGQRAEAGSMALVFPEVIELLPQLKEAIDTLARDSSIGPVSVERLVDLGPHFDRLSPEGQQQARQDWLDLDDLRCWLQRLDRVEIIPSGSAMWGDLMALVDV